MLGYPFSGLAAWQGMKEHLLRNLSAILAPFACLTRRSKIGSSCTILPNKGYKMNELTMEESGGLADEGPCLRQRRVAEPVAQPDAGGRSGGQQAAGAGIGRRHRAG